jgi:hypothetical protein
MEAEEEEETNYRTQPNLKIYPVKIKGKIIRLDLDQGY